MIAVPALWAMMPTPVKKALIYIGIGGAVLWAFKVFWLNPHDNKIESESRIRLSEEIRKDAESKIKAKVAELNAKMDDLESRAKELDAVNAELIKNRDILKSSLDKALAANHAIQEVNLANIKDIPPDKLIASIRALSNQLQSGNQKTRPPN